MGKYSLSKVSEKELPGKTLEELYTSAKKIISGKNGDYPRFKFNDLDCIFNVAITNRNFFPTISIGKKESAEIYIHRWIHSYCNAIQRLPSKREATPKTACSDPVVKEMAKEAKKLSDTAASKQESAHILFMSAENVLGNLLEEYIASRIRPFGWIWCAGETLKSIDFCSEDGTILLQIKNKSNSENSSSNKVREGTTIKKWYRLGTAHKNGMPIPKYRWDKLNDIINEYYIQNANNSSQIKKCKLSEKDFAKFVKKAVEKNPQIITEK